MTRTALALTLLAACGTPTTTVAHRIVNTPTPSDTATPSVTPVVRTREARPMPRVRAAGPVITNHESRIVKSEPESEVVAAIRATFGVQGDRAVRVFTCESKLVPTARNGKYAGLAQIDTVLHRRLIADMGFTVADMYTVSGNLAVARRLYEASGWRPWACR